MNARRVSLIGSIAAAMLVGASGLLASEKDSPSPANTLYVMIENTDPVRFERLRWGRATSDDLILTTLRDSAVEQAKLAEYEGAITVLDEHDKAPDGAMVLNLTWNDRDVTADFTQAGRNKFLGVVNRRPIEFHPEYNKLKRSIDSAGLPDRRRDAVVRAEVQMELYTALKYLVHYQAKVARRE